MAADRLAQAVRHQLGIGRLLPLGGAEDGAWLTERAAAGLLRAAVATALPAVRLDALRLSVAAPEDAPSPAVPPPPTAQPPGALRVTAEFATTVDVPLPVVADHLRQSLLEAAEWRLGLVVEAVDLRVTGLLDLPGDGEGAGAEATEGAEGAGEPEEAGPETPAAIPDGPVRAVAEAVTAVPGVARLAPVLALPLSRADGTRPSRAVHVTDDEDGGADREGEGRRHARVELAVAAGHRALETARQARAAAERALASGPEAGPGRVTAAVLVTAVDLAGREGG